MSKKFFALICIFIFPLVFSCHTAIHVPVPGETAVKIDNIYTEYYNIAENYMSMEKFDKAIEFYDLSMKNKNLYWSALYKKGRAYALAKDYKEARKIYNRLLKRDRTNTDLQVSIAYLYAMEGNYASSVNIYEYLCDKNPENAEILVNFINVLIANSQNDYAEQKFGELKEKFPDNSNIQEFEKIFEEKKDSESDPEKK